MHNVAPAQNPQNVRRSFASSRVIVALILREMTTRYGRSPGGYIWAVLEPVGFIAILSVAFSMIMHTPPLGRSFMLFYATGFLPFHLYQSLQNMTSSAIRFSRPLLFFPAVTWLDPILARFALHLLTGVTVIALLLTVILGLSDVRTVIEYPQLVLAVALAAFLGLGIGTLNCLLFGLFQLWETIWGIVMRPLFLISGVFYLFEDLPRGVQDILWFNPLVHIIGLMRRGIYPSYAADYVAPLYVFLVGLTAFGFGLLFLRSHHKDVLARR